MSQQVVGNNYNKYATRNPIARLLMRGFFEAAGELLRGRAIESVLEVGCGEGLLLSQLLTQTVLSPRTADACDLALDKIAPDAHPKITFHQASAYSLPWPDDSFDLVICCEVLEHLEDPQAAMHEICRVAKHLVLLSTPWEPVWRLLNLARLRYVSALGNTPGHIQHFSRHDLRQLCRASANIIDARYPLPWTMLLATPR